MASTLLDKLDQNLKCGICLENFRNPRGLPCLHSFCEECLERWAKKSKKPDVLTCPNCSRDAQIPEGGVAAFPAHFLVNSLQETVDTEKKIKEEEAVCGLCDTSGKPSSYCRDCEELMCEACHVTHKKINALKDHRIVTIEEFHSGKASKPSKDVYCKKHDGEQIKFYCETCDKLVCRDCILLMKNCCRDHDYCTLKDASQRKIRNLGDRLRECQGSMKKCQSAIEDVEKEETELIQKFLNDRADLSTRKKTLQDDFARIERTCDLGKRLIEKESDIEILSNSTAILETLQQASNTKDITLVVDFCSIC